MMHLFTESSFECSKIITEKYSTSFSLGIKAFAKKYHYPIYGIYGFVRCADEIVDTFHDYDKENLIVEFREETLKAVKNRICLNPVLHSFQEVVNRYEIETDLIEAFLDSMAMDLTNANYTDASYRKYIYGSAEVVGLMCLKVFCENDSQLYLRLKDRAQSLGSAFQKINFLRDIRSDYEERGRTYFPGIDINSFGEVDKQKIEEDILKDFDAALAGIRELPVGVRKGVYVAYVYYYELFEKIRNIKAQVVFKNRIRVSDKRKIWLLAKALVKNRLNAI